MRSYLERYESVASISIVINLPSTAQSFPLHKVGERTLDLFNFLLPRHIL